MTIAYRHYTDIDFCSLDNNLHFSLSILSYRPSRRWDLIRLRRVFSNITNTIVVAKTDSFYHRSWLLCQNCGSFWSRVCMKNAACPTITQRGECKFHGYDMSLCTVVSFSDLLRFIVKNREIERRCCNNNDVA